MTATESGSPLRVVLSPAARNDIREALQWSQERFGERAAIRYRDLLTRALRDLAADPECPGSKERPELAPGIRTCHLYFSRGRARGELGYVKAPRHSVVYRRRSADWLDVVRVLHDARDLQRHRPEEYLDEPDGSGSSEE